MKNFIFALLATLSSFSVSAQFTIDTVFFESFEGTVNNQIPNSVVIFENDSCYFMGSLQDDQFRVYPRGFLSPNDTCLYVRSDYNMQTPPPCQANDWVAINQPIDITTYTWVKWWVKPGSDTSGGAGSQFTETYGIYLADTILPNRADNFLTTPVFMDTTYDFFNDGYYDSLSLSAYDGQRKYIGFRYFSEQKQYINLDDLYVFNRIPVSVDKYSQITYSIYPNPANNIITVESEEMGTLYVYNALGQLLLQQNKNEVKQQVNIANLQNGIYIVQLQTEKGTISHKIQKQ